MIFPEVSVKKPGTDVGFNLKLSHGWGETQPGPFEWPDRANSVGFSPSRSVLLSRSKSGFFISDESGILRLYMITRLGSEQTCLV